MKLIIITLEPATLTWRSLDAKLTAIATALNQTKNATWEVSIEHQALVPAVKAGRITQDWFNTVSYPLFRQGYHLVALHMTKAQQKAWGIQPSLRGANQIDDDFVGECYFWADENTKRGRFNQFIQTCLHECSHELHRATGVPDQTHAYHDAQGDISGIFKTLDMAKWQPAYQAGMSVVEALKKKLASLTAKPSKLFHPVPKEFRRVSQAYGIANSTWYPKTGHHLGADYGTPVGTPIYAPWDCKVTASGTKHETLGGWCHVEYVKDGVQYEERWSHLSRVPQLQAFKRGQVVAYSGDTGLATGPHLHREVWKGDVRPDLITSKNWSEMTIDPETLIYE